MTVQISPASQTEIKRIFQAQQAHQYALGRTTFRERKEKLLRLRDAVLRYRQEIRDALYADFRKPALDVDATEIYAVTSEVKHTLKYLKRWMQPQRVSTPPVYFGSTSWIRYEPKGVALIISPWNFPVNLTFGPLVSAIAAGNAVMLKPSEHTPHASAIMKRIVEEIFDEREVALVEGAVETSQSLLALPFNHIFFTGAPAIGKIVMRAAAEHLTSVTLELGGKSPTIIDETARLDQAARRIAWTKYLNTGQICITPDHVFIHRDRKQAFLDEYGKALREFYGGDPKRSDSFPRMVNRKHFERVKGYLDEARAQGARILYGGETDEAENYIAPTVVTDLPGDSPLDTEEIFGPILPIYTYSDLQEPIEKINAGEKPLSLYIYSQSKKNIRRVLQDTRAGGSCINHSTLHFYNHNLPFGGSNNSGIGKSHGWYGFREFTNARGVYKQGLLPNADLLMPPYNATKQKIVDALIKWL